MFNAWRVEGRKNIGTAPEKFCFMYHNYVKVFHSFLRKETRLCSEGKFENFA